MFLTASGSCAVDDLLLDLECHDTVAAAGAQAEACGGVLPAILHGCELVRRLEDDLPSIASQSHLLLLSCQEISAAFEAAAERLSRSRSPSPDRHNQQQRRNSPSTPQRYQYNNSLPPTPQHLQYSSLLPTPREYQQQYGYSSPPSPPHHPYLYQQQAQSVTPASSSGAAAYVDCYGADEMDSAAQLLADVVDLDFLSANEFQFLDADAADSPETCGTGSVGQQYNSLPNEGASGWGNVAAGTMDADGVLSGAYPENQATAPKTAGGKGANISAAVSIKACPQTEGASRSRVSRKRKDSGECAQTRTIQLPAPRTGDMEAPPDDGYSWRKYGHKDILHARFPRCYYRCIHKSCCDAKKQVQRLDHDPFTYEITYYGHHTCRAPQPQEDAAAAGQHLPTPTSLAAPCLHTLPATKASRKLQ